MVVVVIDGQCTVTVDPRFVQSKNITSFALCNDLSSLRSENIDRLLASNVSNSITIMNEPVMALFGAVQAFNFKLTIDKLTGPATGSHRIDKDTRSAQFSTCDVICHHHRSASPARYINQS